MNKMGLIQKKTVNNWNLWLDNFSDSELKNILKQVDQRGDFKNMLSKELEENLNPNKKWLAQVFDILKKQEVDGKEWFDITKLSPELILALTDWFEIEAKNKLLGKEKLRKELLWNFDFYEKYWNQIKQDLLENLVAKQKNVKPVLESENKLVEKKKSDWNLDNVWSWDLSLRNEYLANEGYIDKDELLKQKYRKVMADRMNWVMNDLIQNPQFLNEISSLS